jgi:hypothetical protein
MCKVLYTEGMNHSFYKKLVQPVLAGTTMAVLLIYGWMTDFKTNDTHKKLSKTDVLPDSCTDATITSPEHENPNVKLFVGCGGFFE